MQHQLWLQTGFPIGYPPFASSTLTILRHGLPLSFLWVSHCTSAPDDLEQNLAHYLFLLIKLYWYLAMPLWIYVVYGLIGYSGRVDDRDQKYCQSWGSSHCGSSVGAAVCFLVVSNSRALFLPLPPPPPASGREEKRRRRKQRL